MVVPVFMTSCQVSEKPNTGPVTAHMIITTKAIIKAAGFPVAFVTILEKLLKNMDMGLFFSTHNFFLKVII